MKDNQGYSLSEASIRTGIKRGTLVYYASLGLVSPEVHTGVGKGSRRLYSLYNLAEFCMIRIISQNGIGLKNVKSILGAMRASKGMGWHHVVTSRVSLVTLDMDKLVKILERGEQLSKRPRIRV